MCIRDRPYIGQYLNKALVTAEDEARTMGDEYVSVEHLFLALLNNPSPSMKKIWNEYGISRERFPVYYTHLDVYKRQP